jgi:hypothetical protein
MKIVANFKNGVHPAVRAVLAAVQRLAAVQNFANWQSEDGV